MPDVGLGADRDRGGFVDCLLAPGRAAIARILGSIGREVSHVLEAEAWAMASLTQAPRIGMASAGRGRFAAAYRAVTRRGVRRKWPSRSRRATAPSCFARRQFQRLRRACWGPTTATPVAAGKAAESSTSPSVVRFFAKRHDRTGERAHDSRAARDRTRTPTSAPAQAELLERRRAAAGVDGPVARVAVRLICDNQKTSWTWKMRQGADGEVRRKRRLDRAALTREEELLDALPCQAARA